MAGSAASVAKLYDTIIFSVASNELGLTSSGSSLYSSDFGSDFDEEQIEEEKQPPTQDPAEEDPQGFDHLHDINTSEHSPCSPQAKSLTPVGVMHSRQLARQLRAKEKELLKKHKTRILKCRKMKIQRT